MALFVAKPENREKDKTMDELTGQQIVRMLLELPPIVENDKRSVITKRDIQEFTRTTAWQNVDAWLRGIFLPKPEHRARLLQMLILEKARRGQYLPVDHQFQA